MGNKQRTKYHVRKRIFLNLDLDMRAFAIAIVEDTREIPDSEDGWKMGEIQLNLGDCNRQVAFHFDMETRNDRRKSLYKIRRIASIVNAVRDAIETEVESIERRKIIKQKPAAKTKSSAG